MQLFHSHLVLVILFSPILVYMTFLTKAYHWEIRSDLQCGILLQWKWSCQTEFISNLYDKANLQFNSIKLAIPMEKKFRFIGVEQRGVEKVQGVLIYDLFLSLGLMPELELNNKSQVQAWK